MIKTAGIFTSIVLLLFLSQTVVPVYGQTGFRLGFVRSFDEEAGDSIWLANTKKKDRIDSRAIARFGAGSFGKINVNGRDIELERVKDHLPDKDYKVGRGGYQIWKGKNVTLRLDYIYTWLCKPDDEQCEVYYYRGVLDINYRGKQRKANVRGFGGS